MVLWAASGTKQFLLTPVEKRLGGMHVCRKKTKIYVPTSYARKAFLVMYFLPINCIHTIMFWK